MKKKINWKIVGIVIFFIFLIYASFKLYKRNNQYEREYEENKILITSLEGDIRDLKNKSRVNRKSAFRDKDDLDLYLEKGNKIAKMQNDLIPLVLDKKNKEVNNISESLADEFSDVNGFEVVSWYLLPDFKGVDVHWEFIDNKDFKGRMVPSYFICRDNNTNDILCRVSLDYDAENKTFTNADKKDTTIGLENKKNLESEKSIRGSDSESERRRREEENE